MLHRNSTKRVLLGLALIAACVSLFFSWRQSPREVESAGPGAATILDGSGEPGDLRRSRAEIATRTERTSAVTPAQQPVSEPAISVTTPAPETDGALIGLLTDEQGRPLARAAVRVAESASEFSGKAFNVHTNASGEFVFRPLPPGVWRINWTPRDSECSTKIAAFELAPGETRVMTFSVIGSRCVTGRIEFGTAWGPDLESAVVQLELRGLAGPDAGEIVASGLATTIRADPERVESSGRFRMCGLRPERYELRAVVFVDGEFLRWEVDLTLADQEMAAFVVEPTTVFERPH